ncbi:MAG: TonB-dependent receptor, partial [Candidatus Eremiobacteraeota bacterium]|nr:TonB-dependent receptor [Candidatus Eremiobacteraeota bacterium]
AGFSVGWIPSDFLQRIDVVKGPGATTPSISNAMNGSVNFVTLDPRRSRAGGEFGIESDGYGGSIERVRYVRQFTNKLSMAVGYQLWDSPGATNDTSEYFVVGKNNTNLINGAPFANCVGTNCQFTLSPNAGSYFQSAALQPYIIQGLGCCVTNESAFTSRSPLVKLRYDISPSFFVDAGYFGNQTYQQVPLMLGTYIFQPGAGYQGSVQPGVVTAVASYGGSTTAPLSGTGYNSALTFNAVGQLRNWTLSAHGIQMNQLQNFGNGLPFSGKASIAPGSVPVTLYGTIASGTPAAYTTYNGTAATFSPGLGSYYYNYGSNLGGLTLQADLPGHNALYTLAFDKTQYRVTYNTDFGFAGPDIASLNPYAGSFEAIQSLLARGSFDLSSSLRAVASVYYNRYNAHASVDNNLTYQDHVSYYTAPRLGLTWRPDQSLSLRFSAGSSVAPAVLTNIIGSFGAVIPYPNPASPSAYEQTVANASVKPETAFGVDGGFDYRFGSSGVVASMDVYSTNLVNELFIATTQNGTMNGLPFYISKYQNIANARDEGVELSLSRDVRRGLFWSLNGALLRAAPYNLGPGFYSSGVAANVANLGIINAANFTGLNNINGTSNYVSIPYSTGSASLGWRGERDGFLRLDGNYYGPNNQYYEPAFTLWSASLGIPLGMKGTLLTMSVANLTNIFPFTTPFQQNGSNGGISPVYVTNQEKAAISDGPGPRALRLGIVQRF